MGKITLMLVTGMMITPVLAAQPDGLLSPRPGVLCDADICANHNGISLALTRQYLGQKKADKLAAQGACNPRAFTFSGGLFCDADEKRCREDRYFGPDGKHSGAVNPHYTQWLFGAADDPSRPAQ